MATAPNDPLIGCLVDGRYEVLSRIARGGMATVYVATDKRLDRHVALKVMHAHLGEGPSGARFVARFRREARSAARLAHPGIVAVYDQGVEGEMSYLAMEYVPGPNLRSALHEDGPFTLGHSLRILEAICEALAAAHRAGIVHRDMKPENVLIDHAGHPRITDFGLARAVDESAATGATTSTVLGTVAYLAPELIATGACDARTDVYAVGIVAYELFTGRLPHTGASPIQVAYQHVNLDVPPPSQTVAWLPSEVDDLVRSLTARDPSNRPAHASEALALLRTTRAAMTDSELDRVPAANVPAAELATAHLTMEAVAVGVGVYPAPTTRIDFAPARPPAPSKAAGSSGGESTSGQAHTPANGSPSRRRVGRLAVVALIALAAALGGGWWWSAQGPGAYTRVPAGIVGAPRIDAVQALNAAGLDHTATTAYHDTVPEGSVVSSNPGVGAAVRKDGSVALVVSRGIEMLTVPEGIVGMDQASATEALTQAGFTLTDPIKAYSDTIASDEVTALTSPQGDVADGATVAHSVALTLTVSAGPEPIRVPDVVGTAQAEAQSALENQGMVVTLESEHSETVAEGLVISQTPAASAEAHRMDPATLVVSKGPPPIALPDMYGRNVKDAEKELRALGFGVEIRYPQSIHPLNLVFSQSPGGGDTTTAPKGSTIVLDVF